MLQFLLMILVSVFVFNEFFKYVIHCDSQAVWTLLQFLLMIPISVFVFNDFNYKFNGVYLHSHQFYIFHHHSSKLYRHCILSNCSGSSSVYCNNPSGHPRANEWLYRSVETQTRHSSHFCWHYHF